MEEKNKWIGIVSKIIVLASVFFIGFSVGVNYTNDSRAVVSDATSQEGVVSLSLDFGNGQIETLEEIEVSAGATVFDVLESSGVEIEYKDFGEGLGYFIESIEGVGKRPVDQGKWWQFWVNGEYSEVGASFFEVESGDEIKFRFTGDQELIQ